MESFMSLDVTPARVVALYPAESVSGRLHLPLDRWVEAFGGPAGGRLVPVMTNDVEEESEKGPKLSLLKQMPHLGLASRASIDTLKDDHKDKESIAGEGSGSSVDSTAEFESECTH
jgi:Vam6/Vps39-like protein vacuolar protein sorting-associated protein 39